MVQRYNQRVERPINRGLNPVAPSPKTRCNHGANRATQKTTKMENYDNWKAHDPDTDFWKGSRCLFCGEQVPDGEKFCATNCRVGYEND